QIRLADALECRSSAGVIRPDFSKPVFLLSVIGRSDCDHFFADTGNRYGSTPGTEISGRRNNYKALIPHPVHPAQKLRLLLVSTVGKGSDRNVHDPDLPFFPVFQDRPDAF